MKKKQVRPPRPDSTLIASFEAHQGNLGDCRDRTYSQMRADYQRIYGSRYSEHELERMHEHWKRIAAMVK